MEERLLAKHNSQVSILKDRLQLQLCSASSPGQILLSNSETQPFQTLAVHHWTPLPPFCRLLAFSTHLQLFQFSKGILWSRNQFTGQRVFHQVYVCGCTAASSVL